MIELLDELTEIPFDIFWEKYIEIRPGVYNILKAKAIWFAMLEADRISAFATLAKDHWIMSMYNEPYEYLKHFA